MTQTLDAPRTPAPEAEQQPAAETPPPAPPAAPPAEAEPAAVAPRPEVRRQLSGIRISDLLALIGAAVAAVSLTGLLFTQLAPLDGVLPFVLISYVFFVAIYALLVSFDERGPVVVDRIIAVIVHSLAFLVLAVLLLIIIFTFARGAEALPHWNFFTQDMSEAGPLDPLSMGGVLHAIVGSLIQIGIALLITIPLGITTAVFLNEVPGRFARFVRTITEAMTALPSIVSGLFIYATVILTLGMDKSGFAASLAISIMMLPIMIRSADVVLRLVPATLKEASVGLGAGQWKTVWHVVLPTSRSGLMTGIILATARGIGETSPVLLTAGFTAALNTNPFQGPMISLPLAIFEFYKSPEPTMIARAFGTAAVLMILVFILFIIARVIGGETIAKRERRRERFQAFFASLSGLLTRTPAAATPARGGEGSAVTSPAATEAPATPDSPRDAEPASQADSPAPKNDA